MAIEIDFSYMIGGSFDSINYYRSTSTMDVNAMPPAIATGITSLTYTDTSAVLDTFYYFRFGSVKNGVEKISEEVSFKAKKFDQNYLIKLVVIGGQVRDQGTLDTTWTAQNTTLSSTSTVLFNSYQSYLLADKSFNFNQNFKITFEFNRLTSTAKYPALISIVSDNQWNSTLRRFNLGIGGVGGNDPAIINKVYVARSKSGVPNVAVNKTISNNVWYFVEFSRSGNVFTIKVDDVSATFTETDAFNSVPTMLGLSLVNGSDGQFNGYIRNFNAHVMPTI